MTAASGPERGRRRGRPHVRREPPAEDDRRRDAQPPPGAESLRVEASRAIRVPPDRVFPIISRVETLPRYSRLWAVADLGGRRQHQTTVRLRGYFCGLPVESTLRVQVRSPRVEFRQSHGSFREFSGALSVRPAEEGAEITYLLEADPAIAIIDERAARLALTQEVLATLDKVKIVAERTLRDREVRRLKMRQRAKAAADSGNGAGDAGDDDAGEAEEPAEAAGPPPAAPPDQPAAPSAAGKRRRRRKPRRPRA